MSEFLFQNNSELSIAEKQRLFGVKARMTYIFIYEMEMIPIFLEANHNAQ
jgi:hypothetical protein